MKAAFAAWDNRIAPVFDVARTLVMVEKTSKGAVRKISETLPGEMPARKALFLAERGVSVLVCGAISRPMHAMVASYGIRVIPFISGELDRVVEAWTEGRLDQERFAMPGCCGRAGRPFCEPYGFQWKEDRMNGMNRGGRGGGGGGQGRGRQGGGGGRMGGQALGPSGDCVCPKCGYREAHQRTVPCMEKKCPKCDIALIRG